MALWGPRQARSCSGRPTAIAFVGLIVAVTMREESVDADRVVRSPDQADLALFDKIFDVGDMFLPSRSADYKIDAEAGDALDVADDRVRRGELMATSMPLKLEGVMPV